MVNNNIGIDIGGTKMLMLAEHDGKYLEKTVPTGPDCTKEFIRDQILIFIESLPFPISRIGMALPGLVNNGNLLISSDVLPGLDGVDSSYFSSDRYLVKFINDVKAATLAEACNYKDSQTIAVVMNGTGIAAGVAINGKLLEGSQGFAGEIGYAYVPYKGGIERFDNLSSGDAILKKAQCTPTELINRINSGCEKSKEIINEAGYYFGLVLGLMIQFYNPTTIVVGGSTSTYPGFMEKAINTAKICTLPEMFNNCSIVPPKDIKRIVAKWGLLVD